MRASLLRLENDPICTYHSSAAQEDIVLVRIEPSDQSPCPGQMVEYECRIQTPVNTLAWTLPTGVDLPALSGFEGVGTVRMDGSFTAHLTGVNSGDISGEFFLNSTIVFPVNTNNSNLRCSGILGTDSVQASTTIILSGDYIIILVHCYLMAYVSTL